MILDMIAPAGADALWTTVLLTVILGGAAASAAGRAVAQTWRRAGTLVAYAFLLACAFGFLDYALFGNPVIPGARILGDLARLFEAPGSALSDLALSLGGLLITFAFMLAVTLVSFRIARVRQMARQYDFAIEQRGLFTFAGRDTPAP